MPPTIRYDSPAFDALAAELARGFGGANGSGDGSVVLFAGAGADARHVALGRLADAAHLPLTIVPLDTRDDARPAAVQGNLREVFDAAGAELSVLCLDHADGFFRHAAEGAAPGALTAVGYLFERAKRFRGLVVVCLSDPALVAAAAGEARAVVTF